MPQGSSAVRSTNGLCLFFGWFPDVLILCADVSEQTKFFETSAHKIQIQNKKHNIQNTAKVWNKEGYGWSTLSFTSLMEPESLLQFFFPNFGLNLPIPAYCCRGKGLADLDSGGARRPTATRHYPDINRQNCSLELTTVPLRWCSWLRHCATRRKVAGSIPDGVIGIFHCHNPSSRTKTLRPTQSLLELSTRNTSRKVKAAGA